MKAAACAAIDKNADKIIALGESIYREPELGYKEFKTSAKIKAALDEIGFEHQDGVAVTGIITPVKGRDHKVNLAIMGELDAVVAPSHPFADPVTGAAHSCGHFAQAASVIGVAYALKESGVMNELDGDITLMHVPAEEFVELEYRKSLIDEGKISLLGGKQEFIKLGVFDNVDMMIMQHTRTTEGDDPNPIKADAGGTGMGFIGKMIQYIGKESHAAAPSQGINALKAAQIGLAAIDANRETFQDKDTIRIHPIITKGGTLVNIVPNDVRMEMYVRGATIEAIKDANTKVNRAIKGAAYAIGCEVEINDMPGDLPCIYDQTLAHIYGDNGAAIFPDREVVYSEEIGGGSSDMGDIATVIPAVQPGTGGIVGNFHSKDFTMEYPDEIYLDPAKLMACSVVDLLWDNAEKAKEVIANFKSPYNTKTFDKVWEEIMGK